MIGGGRIRGQCRLFALLGEHAFQILISPAVPFFRHAVEIVQLPTDCGQFIGPFNAEQFPLRTTRFEGEQEFSLIVGQCLIELRDQPLTNGQPSRVTSICDMRKNLPS